MQLDDLDSNMSMPSGAMKRSRFNLEGLTFGGLGKNNPSKSVRVGMMRGSEGLLTFGRSLRTGVTRAVFPEDLKVSNTMIFDPQNRSIMLWNKFFLVSCILSVSLDPLFFYLPVFNPKSNCLGMDSKLAVTTTIIRTIIDTFYLIRMVFQFRTAFIAPSSQVFGRSELVIDPGQIAKRYLTRYFIVDFLSVLPLPQMVVWKNLLMKSKGSEVWKTNQALLAIVVFQYIPRFVRVIPLTSELKKQAFSFADGTWIGAANFLLWFMLASHIVGALWYLLAVERKDLCWRKACEGTSGKCLKEFLYCGGNKHMKGLAEWRKISESILSIQCDVKDNDASPFNFGIYTQAIQIGVVSTKDFFTKLCYCLLWGIQNISTLGKELLPSSTYLGEVLFCITITTFRFILFALLIVTSINMQEFWRS